jgi:Protein of unknown function (DUF2752)
LNAVQAGAVEAGTLGTARAWRAWLLAGAALAAGLVLAAWTPPDDPAWSVCLFRRLAHVPCATCGMTRALSLLAHGDLRGSLVRHPLAAPFAAEAAALWLLAPLALRRGWRPPGTWARGWLLGHLALLLAVWLVRLAV